MSVDLKQECARLQLLAKKGQNPSTRKELMDGLNSKWEGVQITAARSLAKWGDAASLSAIKGLLIDLLKKDQTNGAIAASTVASTLAPHLCEDDLPWVLELYFVHAKPTNRSYFACLFSHLPPKPTITALKKRELTSQVNPRDLRTALEAVDRAARGRL